MTQHWTFHSLPQHDETLENTRVWEELVGAQLCPVSRRDPDRCLMRLEAADTHPRARQSDRVDRLTNANSDRFLLQLLVQGDKELRVHGGYQPVHHPVLLAQHDCISDLCSCQKGDDDLQDFASMNEMMTDSNPATAVRLMTIRSLKNGLIPIVPLPMWTRPCEIRTMNSVSASLL